MIKERSSDRGDLLRAIAALYARLAVDGHQNMSVAMTAAEREEVTQQIARLYQKLDDS
jgi:hypothetical protein